MRRSGFTLVEMVAATIVIAMLFGVLSIFMRSVVGQRKRADAVRLKHPDTAVFEDQLVRDVRNANGWASDRSGLTLFGGLATNPLTGLGTHQLARVGYSVQTVGGTSVLVRTEQVVRGPSHQRVVWFNTSGLSASVARPSGLSPESHETGGLHPMPIELHVTLDGADGSTVLSRRVRHHEELQ